MIRKKGLGFLLVIAGVMMAVLLLINDALVDRMLESTGESIVGAQVDFDGVDFSLLRLRLRWQRLQVTDPMNTMRNIIETGFTEMNILTEPLLLKRFVVENMESNNVRFYTQRETDGALPGKKAATVTIVQRIQSLLFEEISPIKDFDIRRIARINADSIVDIIGLRTPDRVDSLLQSARGRLDAARRRVDRADREQERLDRIRADIESIAADSVKTAEDLNRIAQKAQTIGRRLDSAKATVDSVRTATTRDLEEIRRYDEHIKQWIGEDYRRVRERIRIPEINATTVARALFGPAIVNRIQSLLTYVGIGRYYGEKVQEVLPEKREEPPRFQGQTIRFSATRDWPSFWLKRIAASGVIGESLSLEGLVRDITTGQSLIGLPTVAQLAGSRAGGAAAELTGRFNYLSDIPREFISAAASRVALNNISLAQSSLLPAVIRTGLGAFTARLNMTGGQLSFDGSFNGTDLVWELIEQGAAPEKELRDLYESMIRSLRTLSLRTAAVFADDMLRLTVSSDLAAQIVNTMRTFVESQFDAVRRRVETLAAERTRDERGALASLGTDEIPALQARLDAVDTQVRELEQRLAEELRSARRKTEGRVRERLEERLKDLF